jgi:2-polyprenyl-6-methoxyphenol hydroxylase-like FAD-dependent oxidoreductase
MNILVVGAGIAGPTLAYWLAHHGHRPTLLERAPALRRGGYVVDFWGAAFDIAERMQLVPRLMREGYLVREVRFVNDRGGRVGGFDASVFGRIAGGRYVSIPRSALSAAIYDRLDGGCETIFGDHVVAIDQDERAVRVDLAHGGTRGFDLVIGADGLHSEVRSLVFGKPERFERYLGHRVAVFQVKGYRPRNDDTYLMYSTPGLQAGRLSLRNDETMFVFIWRDETRAPLPHDRASQRALLADRFANTGWECRHAIEASATATDLYLDDVSQIWMDRWSRGRVALVGDAAYCVSLVAGQGSALAMVGATVLAGELHAADGDPERAFAAYEGRLREFVRGKQIGAERFAEWFVPPTPFRLAVRNAMTRMFSIPYVAERAIGAELRDVIAIPTYR